MIFSGIYPLVFMPMLSNLLLAQGGIFSQRYKSLSPGKSLRGSVVEKISINSRLKCAARCFHVSECTANQYSTKSTTCALITTTGNGTKEFTSGEYNKVYVDLCIELWKRPVSWASGDPVVYRSLDAGTCFKLMNGSQTINVKFGTGVKLNRTHEQWVEFGNITDVCLVQPATCGPEGAAFALWEKLVYCPSQAGIITSQTTGKTGFQIICLNNDLNKTDKHYFRHTDPKGPRLHLAGVYYGASEGGGIALHRDGTQVARTTTLTPMPLVIPGSGKLVLGRIQSLFAVKYASVEVDEILFFNHKLSSPEVQMIYNATGN